MIAIVTTSKVHFDHYVAKMNLSKKEAKQVRVLSDIKNVTFSASIEIDGSNNVTDYVIKNIQIKE